MLVLICLFLIWLIVMLFSRLSLIRIQAHWHGKNTVITQFTTPHNLSPAEFGYIFDRKFGRNEMKATIADLFQRNIISLRKTHTIAGNDIIITANTKKPKKYSVDDCEAVLVSHVNYSHGGQRSWKDLSSVYSRETGTRWQYERAVISQLIDKGYLTKRALNEPFVDRFVKSTLAFSAAWFLFFTTLGNQIAGTSHVDKLDKAVSVLFLLPVFLLIWLGLYVYLSILSQEIRLSAGLPRFATEKLRSEWADVVGFRDYLRVVEWHRLRHMPDLKNKALPYCLAAGYKVSIEDVIAAD